MKKTVSLGLAVLLAIGFCGCSKSPKSPKAKADALMVWTADSLTKVLLNGEYGERETTPLKVQMAKGETEGGQIILTAKKDIEKYTAEAGRLMNGLAAIPAANVGIYAAKYIRIDTKGNVNTAFPQGSWMPDALLPIDKAAYYKENNIKKGDNQAVYVEVTTPADCPAGIYKGDVKIIADGGEYVVPVEIEVWDFTVPASPSVKNFMNPFGRDHFASAELDGTDEMAEAYFEKFLEYRMSSELPFAGVGGKERYVELLRKYYNWPGFSSYRFYYECFAGYYMDDEIPFNVSLLQEYLEAVAEASVEDGVNYLDKAMFYFLNVIDEPGTPSGYEHTKRVTDAYDAVLRTADAALKMKLVVSKNYQYYLNVVSPTLLAIPNVLPVDVKPLENLENVYGVTSLTPCLLIDRFHDREAREAYFQAQAGKEFWWYTAVGPQYPQPNNHLDDFLASWRVMTWEQRAYGIAGHLNWAMNNYFDEPWGMPLADPYGSSNRGFVPGDGFVFYPGYKYGIKGPVASLRAVSYRDGMEEYEYLAELERRYAVRGVSSDSVLDDIYGRMFTGTVPTTSSETFYRVRAELAALIELAGDSLGVLYGDTEILRGKADVSFDTVRADASVSYNGTVLTRGVSGKYTLNMDLRQTNLLTLTVEYGGKSKTSEKRICGVYREITGFEDGDLSFIRVHETSSAEINSNSAYVAEGTKSLKAALRGRPLVSGYTPFFSMPAKKLNEGKLNELESLFISVYNAHSAPVVFSLETFTGSQYDYIGSYTLTPGWNDIRIRGLEFWPNLSSVEDLYFRTENFLGERVFYIDAVAIAKI